MTKTTKILIRTLISFMIDIALINAYGFIIGGYVGLPFYLLMIIINFFLIMFSLGKDFVREKVITTLMIAVAVSYCGSLFYQWENNVFDNKVVDTYESYVMDLQVGRYTFMDRGCYFKNPAGEECFFNYYLNDEYYDGDKVEVREYNGIFGIKHYRFTLLERND